MALVTATDADWQAMTGKPAPRHWIGLIYTEGGERVGLGAVQEMDDGRWWIVLKAKARRPVALWKGARELIETAQSAGVTLHALSDPRIPRADAVLERLGFVRSTDELGGHHIWTR